MSTREGERVSYRAVVECGAGEPPEKRGTSHPDAGGLLKRQRFNLNRVALATAGDWKKPAKWIPRMVEGCQTGRVSGMAVLSVRLSCASSGKLP